MAGAAVVAWVRCAVVDFGLAEFTSEAAVAFAGNLARHLVVATCAVVARVALASDELGFAVVACIALVALAFV